MPCFLSISLASETCPRRRAGGACDEPTDRRGGQVGADFSYDLAVPAESRPPWLATADMRQERVSVCTLSSSSERQKCHPSAKRKVSPIRPGRTLLALTGLWNVYSANSLLGWDDLARLWIARLPIAGALIWLALHASRESALAKRLEEDYGYKAAIASSFQGFQKQMAEIGAKAPVGSPLAKLCDDTLSTIASPPGRIYDKHRLTVSPTGDLADAATKAISPVKPGPD